MERKKTDWHNEKKERKDSKGKKNKLTEMWTKILKDRQKKDNNFVNQK